MISVINHVFLWVHFFLEAVTLDYDDVILETQANNDPCDSLFDKVEMLEIFLAKKIEEIKSDGSRRILVKFLKKKN